VFPGISRDGSRLVYLALRTPAAQVWKKDLATGVETQIYRAAGINRLKVTPDGSTAFFRILEGRAPQLQTIYALDVAGGPARKICDNCGAPTSISPSGEFVAHETGSAVPRLAVIDLRTGERREILRHHHHGVQGGRISPDGHSIVFELDRARDGIELFAAPFRGLEPIPETGWIPISDPSVSSFEAAWSPDGSSVYFLSDRSGSRDLWMQRLQPDRRAMGQPALVRRFADPRLTPLTFHMRAPRYVGLSISARDAVLTLSEMNTSVWLGRLGR
jgi:Tol biopolymer transport system component